MDEYAKIERRGEGAHGKVYKARHTASGEMVALKVVKLRDSSTGDRLPSGLPVSALREIALLKELRHPAIVLLRDVVHDARKLAIVFEFVDTDLRKFLDDRQSRFSSVAVGASNGVSAAGNGGAIEGSSAMEPASDQGQLHDDVASSKLDSYGGGAVKNHHDQAPGSSDIGAGVARNPSADLGHSVQAAVDDQEAGMALPLALVRTFMRQLLGGIAYCHRMRVLHRDLKPENLLINPRRNQLKLADFGLARSYGVPVRGLSSEVATLWYRAPELLLGSTDYGTAVDVWSCGCVFAEMASGVPLFPGTVQSDQLMIIFRTLGTPTPTSCPELVSLPAWPGSDNHPVESGATLSSFPEHAPQLLADVVRPLFAKNAEAADLLARMLDLSPSRRITAAEAVSHPFFNSSSFTVPNSEAGLAPAADSVASHSPSAVADSAKQPESRSSLKGSNGDNGLGADSDSSSVVELFEFDP